VRRVLTLVVILLALAPGVAHAHGDEGRLEVVNGTPDDTGSAVTYRVRLTYLNDGDPVDGATVTATPALQGQPPAEAVPMTGTGTGIYEATIGFASPGRWTVRFDAADPLATAETTFRVQPPPPTTEPSAVSTVPPTTTVPADGATLADDDGGSDGPPAFLVVGLVVAGVLLVGGGTALLLRRRRDAA